MKKTTFLLAFMFAAVTLIAQKRMTTSATINFDATTSSDKLPKAENKTVVAAIELRTGSIAFEAMIKSFSFSNPMMQDHFNGENWLESDKFPTATFKGKITNFETINFMQDGTYFAEVSGDLTIHGMVKPVKATGYVSVAGKSISVVADFTIKLEDYGITGKAIDGGKIAKEPKVSVTADFK
jgi:polyisoprenoid-binding protein YceI